MKGSNREVYKKGNLLARPASPDTATQVQYGMFGLGLDKKRDCLVYVPAQYTPNTPCALAVMLHGAGGNADHGMHLIQHLADVENIILVAPASQGGSWDIINTDNFGADVILIDQALTEVFNRYTIDASRLAIGGFSDGASYALSLGLINGDLFTHIIAFSPGFAYAPQAKGQPEIYVSHGMQDEVLPINSCSRRLVPLLKKQGYAIVYHEFDGPHIIPENISREAVNWFKKNGSHSME